MDNNLVENMVDAGTEVVDEAVMEFTPLKVGKYILIGAMAGAATFLFVKYIAVPCVRKAKNKFEKKKDVLDLEEFEG